jgi:hypothetical protein
MKTLLITVLLSATPALACSPAPSCWIDEGPTYLKEICKGYQKDHRTLADIKTWLDEPEKISEFAAACKQVGITLKAK